jgi:hypothetical protein
VALDINEGRDDPRAFYFTLTHKKKLELKNKEQTIIKVENTHFGFMTPHIHLVDKCNEVKKNKLHFNEDYRIAGLKNDNLDEFITKAPDGHFKVHEIECYRVVL